MRGLSFDKMAFAVQGRASQCWSQTGKDSFVAKVSSPTLTLGMQCSSFRLTSSAVSCEQLRTPVSYEYLRDPQVISPLSLLVQRRRFSKMLEFLHRNSR